MTMNLQHLIETGMVVLPKATCMGRPPREKAEAAKRAAALFRQQKTLQEICDEVGANYGLAKWYLYKDNQS